MIEIAVDPHEVHVAVAAVLELIKENGDLRAQLEAARTDTEVQALRDRVEALQQVLHELLPSEQLLREIHPQVEIEILRPGPNGWRRLIYAGTLQRALRVLEETNL